MEIPVLYKKKLARGFGIFALLLFAIGAQAAWLVSLSDTMSSQATSALSNHTFSFTTRTGAAEGRTIVISLASAFDTSTIDFTDMDLAVGGTDRTLAADCSGTQQLGVSVASDVVTFTVCAGDGGAIAANGVVVIEIGTNATAGVAGDQQIRNPGATGSHDITIGGTFGDRGNLAVAIESTGSVSVSGTVSASTGGQQGGGGPGGGPAGDREPPVISSVLVTDIIETGARVTWRTDENADSKVDHGLTASYELGSRTDVALLTSHSIALTGLRPGTTYHYRARSADLSGNEASSPDLTFRTAAPPDTTAPVISDVQVINITSTSATIAWATNEDATSAAEYGLTDAYERGMISVVPLVTEHEVVLSGLLSATTYHYRVRSRDAVGNEAISGDFTFRTLAPPDLTPPTISDIAVVDITQTSARVTWRTNERATSEARSGRTVAYERGTVTDPVLVVTHSITLTGLLPRTLYHFAVRSVDGALNGASSTDRTFTTLPDETPPTNVSDFRAIEITPGSVRLTWRNPPDDDFAGVRIVRRADRFPANATDGTTVFDGLAEAATDAGLSPSTTYRYGAFAYDTSSNFASGALVEIETVAVCGDDLCTSGESAANCPRDCAVPPESVCGNTICEADESPFTCPADCGAPPGVRCGNSACELGEDALSCPADCAAPPEPVACGNDICEIGESPESCPDDCPAPAVLPVCGNEMCEAGETQDSCPADCLVIEVPPPTVGAGEALDTSDLHFLVANQQIELVPAARTYGVLLGTVLWVSVDIESFVRESAEVRLILGPSAYRLAREEDAYRTAVLTPTTPGRIPAVLSVLYPDGVSDRVDVLVQVRPWGEVTSTPDGASIMVGNALVTLSDASGAWDGTRFGEDNPMRTRPDGSFAWYVPNGSYRLGVVADGYRTESRRVTVTDAMVRPRIVLIPLPPPILLTLQDIFTGEESLRDRVLATGDLIGRVVDYGYDVVRIEVLDNPQVEQASQVVAPAVAVVAIASVGAAASAAGLANVIRFLFTQPIVFFTRRKRKAWGMVFNAITKVPVDLVVVRLHDAVSKRLVQTRVTDREGRYFFIVQPGEYLLEVQKLHFIFPSAYLRGVRRDPLHLDIYHGESIVVTDRDATIAANIPMDPEVKEEVPARILHRIFWGKFQAAVALTSPIIALLAVIIAPTPLTAGLFVLQLALYGIFQWIIRPRKPKGWGIVYDVMTRKPLGRAIVRIFEPIYGKLLEMQVTDANGRYSFVVGPNKYRLASEKTGYEQATTDLDFSDRKEPSPVKEDLALKPGEEPEDDEWKAEPV